MTSTAPEHPVDHLEAEAWLGLTWSRLVVVTGSITALATIGLAIYLTDIEGAVLAAGFGLFTWLFASGREKSGVIGLLALSAITYFFMVTAAFINFRGGSGMEGVLIAGGLSGVAAMSLAASIGWLVRRGRTATFGPWVVVGVVVFVFTQPLMTGYQREASPVTGDVTLVAENTRYSESVLSVSDGQVTVELENNDLFWHTFTVDGLGVDLKVPVRGESAVEFQAVPGEYEFYCAIPGHRQAGMVGTLVVES